MLGALIVIGFLLPYTDENLLKASGEVSAEAIAVSPFALVFKRAGLAVASHIINAVILTAVLSCSNFGLYAYSRMLFAMVKEGKAPKAFGKVNSRGVPVAALIFTTAFGGLSYLTKEVGAETAYTWLLNMAGVIGFIAWLGIGLTHYRFRKAFVAQKKDWSRLKYRAKCFLIISNISFDN